MAKMKVRLLTTSNENAVFAGAWLTAKEFIATEAALSVLSPTFQYWKVKGKKIKA